ncbi:MauE/DoxX family redox-associated membrane protein [Paenibacillus humicus]|uniref:MauE/DoxX family redox-associated membrane protein n=1 Tax=Paenibacillus humicus TaxID=412861 RepID=UPI003D2A516F
MIIYFQVFISLLLFVSSITKIFNLTSFQKTIDQLEPIKIVKQLGAMTVIIIELIIGITILFKELLIFALILLFLLLLSFLWAAVRAMSLHRLIDCNCFGGVTNESLGWGTILKVVALALCGAALLLSSTTLNIWNYPLKDILGSLYFSISILTLYSLINITIKLFESVILYQE